MKKQDSDKPEVDIFGKAISAYFHHRDETGITVHSPDFEDDEIPVAYLFRDYEDMPLLEQKALDMASGRVLDVGCGAGSHALYLQENKNLEVTGIDISAGAIEICRERGLNNVYKANFFDLGDEEYDTILLLMNGSGIIGKMERLDDFFLQAKKLLKPGGQILLDSTDVSYLFDADEEGGIWVDPEEGYYGEMEFSISYKGEISAGFPWLYLDYQSLELAAENNGFSCSRIKKGKHYDYLAQLKPL